VGRHQRWFENQGVLKRTLRAVLIPIKQVIEKTERRVCFSKTRIETADEVNGLYPLIPVINCPDNRKVGGSNPSPGN
jgi:hypothetical protein